MFFGYNPAIRNPQAEILALELVIARVPARQTAFDIFNASLSGQVFGDL